jgi:MFS family permease
MFRVGRRNAVFTTKWKVAVIVISNEDVMPFGLRVARHNAMISICMVMFLTFLDMTIVSVALGSVQSHLHAGVTQLQWVVNGYGLTFASFMLLGGTLGDRLGRKKVMPGGLLLFATGSLLGALAPNPDVQMGVRVIMGIGAAALEPSGFPDQAGRALMKCLVSTFTRW